MSKNEDKEIKEKTHALHTNQYQNDNRIQNKVYNNSCPRNYKNTINESNKKKWDSFHILRQRNQSNHNTIQRHQYKNSFQHIQYFQKYSHKRTH
jgi:flagellar biosynthesis/type III secretory pathway chaperone